MIVVLENHVQPGLRLLADCHGLPVLEAGTADQAFRHIVCMRPRVIIVQMSELLAETLDFIRAVIGAAQPIPVIVAAAAHSREIERAALIAGATCYVADTEASVVDEALEAVLAPSG